MATETITRTNEVLTAIAMTITTPGPDLEFGLKSTASVAAVAAFVLQQLKVIG